MCPPAPLLVPGLADGLAASVPELRSACLRAVSVLANADAVLLISTGAPRSGGALFPPGSPVSAAAMARSDRQVVRELRLSGGTPAGQDPLTGVPEYGEVTVGTAVGAQLLAAAGIDRPVTAIQIDPAAPVLPALPGQGRTALLVMADGAACHGEHAPGAPDGRAERFDEQLLAALRSGRPEGLSVVCRTLAAVAPALLAGTLPALATMAALAADSGPAGAELLHYSAPFGVGYPVAVWLWA